MQPPSDTTSLRSSIVTHLTIKLVAVALFAIGVNGLIPTILDLDSPFSLTLLFLGNVVSLWLAVEAVFAALEKLLEAKLNQALAFDT